MQGTIGVCTHYVVFQVTYCILHVSVGVGVCLISGGRFFLSSSDSILRHIWSSLFAHLNLARGRSEGSV